MFGNNEKVRYLERQIEELRKEHKREIEELRKEQKNIKKAMGIALVSFAFFIGAGQDMDPEFRLKLLREAVEAMPLFPEIPKDMVNGLKEKITGTFGEDFFS